MFVESEKTIFFALGLVTFIALASLVLVFQNAEKTANLVYSKRAALLGTVQKGMNVKQWTDAEQLRDWDDGYRRQDVYPRHGIVQPGTYEFGLRGNYNSGRFGGVVPGNTYDKYRSEQG